MTLPSRDAMSTAELRRRADQASADVVELMPYTTPRSPVRRRLSWVQGTCLAIVADLDQHPHLVTELPEPQVRRARRLAFARWDAWEQSTTALRRTERTFRRLSTSGERLGTVALAAWVGVRSELARRGVQLPDATTAPRRGVRGALRQRVARSQVSARPPRRQRAAGEEGDQ